HMQRGRAFTADEARTRAPVAIVDTAFADRVFVGRDPLGQTIKIASDDKTPLREVTIVGVAPTIKRQSLDEKPGRPAVCVAGELPLNGMLLVRTHGDSALLAAPIKNVFHELAPAARLRDITPMRERIAQTLRDRERLNALLGLLGMMAV